MVLAQKQQSRSIEHDRSLEIKPHTYGHLIYDKGGKTIQRRKYRLFNKCAGKTGQLNVKE